MIEAKYSTEFYNSTKLYFIVALLVYILLQQTHFVCTLLIGNEKVTCPHFKLHILFWPIRSNNTCKTYATATINPIITYHSLKNT